ncbi:MAG: hypothetical protein RIR46_543 [Actinomycetota bacterium]|jgi:hypothetical protein
MSSKFKSVKLAAALLLVSPLLTACDPPMPPEALAALAEASFTCVEGDVPSYFSEEVADGAPFLAENLALNCPGMSYSIVDGASAELVASSNAQSGPGGSAYATVPYAVESGVFVITSSAGASALFSPATVQGVLDGSITTWDAPQILEDNAGVAPLDGPLTLVNIAQKDAVSALEVWYQHYSGKKLSHSLDVRESVEVADFENLPEGSIAFMPGAVFTALSNIAMVTPMAANLLVDVEKFPLGATPDMTSIQTAASQWKTTKTETAVSVTMEFAAKPVPPVGFDEAPAPYQIIYPVNLSLFGTDNLSARATARYLLRQDSQGSLTLVASLPVSVRADALAFISKGLPTPTLAPEQE